jgi:peroxiredoxin
VKDAFFIPSSGGNWLNEKKDLKVLMMKFLERFRRRDERPQSASALTPLPAGTLAPDFNLLAASGQRFSLADFQGKPLVLVFYPEDNSPVCSSQLALYNQVLPMFEELEASLVGISVDDPESHRAFVETLNLNFPLLADDTPAGEIARAYGIFDQQAGTSGRALFVIDAEGVIHWSYISPTSVNPGADGILDALEELSAQITSA